MKCGGGCYYRLPTPRFVHRRICMKMFEELTSHLSRHSPDSTWNCPRWVTFLYMSQFIWTEELPFFFTPASYWVHEYTYQTCRMYYQLMFNFMSLETLQMAYETIVFFDLETTGLSKVNFKSVCLFHQPQCHQLGYIKQDHFYEAFHCQCYHGHLFYNVGLKYAFILIISLSMKVHIWSWK